MPLKPLLIKFSCALNHKLSGICALEITLRSCNPNVSRIWAFYNETMKRPKAQNYHSTFHTFMLSNSFLTFWAHDAQVYGHGCSHQSAFLWYHRLCDFSSIIPRLDFIKLNSSTSSSWNAGINFTVSVFDKLDWQEEFYSMSLKFNLLKNSRLSMKLSLEVNPDVVFSQKLESILAECFICILMAGIRSILKLVLK